MKAKHTKDNSTQINYIYIFFICLNIIYLKNKNKKEYIYFFITCMQYWDNKTQQKK